MASQSSYSRGGNRFYHPSLTSVGADQFGNTREMGPPSDFPPQPVEIDLSLSRTLPTPSTFVTTTWDSSASFQPNNLGDYAPSVAARSQQITVDNQTRTQHDPLHLWYSANDGPWVPRDALPEDSSQSKQAGSHLAMAYRGQYRQPNPSEAGSYNIGIAPSDSGYGTRKSDANTSVFSGDFPERDQDCQSLVSHVQDFQPFQAYGNSLQPHDVRTAGSWTSPTSNASEPSGLVCPHCQKGIKTQSDLKKHHLRHTKPFICNVTGCNRREGFSTKNDLDRHIKSKHPASDGADAKKFRCKVPGCKSKEKSWPRLDNFRSHLKRVHSSYLPNEEAFEEMIRSGQYLEKPDPSIDSEILPEIDKAPEIVQSKPMANDNLSLTRHSGPWPQTESSSLMPSTRRGQFVPPVGLPAQRSPLPEEPQQTVQPLDIYPYGRAPESSVRLDRVLSAPVSRNDARKSDDEDRQLPRRANTDVATRQTNEKKSALEATMTEFLEVLTAADPAGVMHTASRNPLPDGKISPSNSWSVAREPTLPITDKRTSQDRTDRSSGTEDLKDPQVSETTLEVFKALANRLGFTVHKDQNQPPTPKIQNAGSVASNKSDHQVTCEVCKKFKGRPCELRKHMKRHERPYGCTFQTCKKSFGSKNDWKRHENSQHFHLETWRCDLDRPEGGETPCAKVCYRRQTFQEHLKKEHRLTNEDEVSKRLETCRIGRNCQARFWCGFCKHLVNLSKKGLDAWTERFDHIDDHFMGRNSDAKKWNINDWVPIDGDKSFDQDEASPSKNSPTSEDSPSDNTAPATPGGSPDHAIDVEAPRSQKRKASGSDDDQPRKQARAGRSMEKRVICCQCGWDQNPRINVTCINSECPGVHRFEGCTSCKVEYQPAPES